MASLQIREIYRSIQGESTFAGWPCTFVRTSGCDIRCVYCDEVHAFRGGERLEVEEVLARVKELDTELVEVTGGEPLLQRSLPELVERLLEIGHQVLVETGGHLSQLESVGGRPINGSVIERVGQVDHPRFIEGGGSAPGDQQ